MQGGLQELFPSPCGVLVLKCLEKFSLYLSKKRGFRPLAGFWFLNAVSDIAYVRGGAVSVPLRGSGS